MSEFRDRKTSSSSGLAAELKNLVGDSLQNSANTYMRSLNLFKAVTSNMPRQKIGALDMAKSWARINLETSHIINRHTRDAVNEILDVLEKHGLADSGSEETAYAKSPPTPEEKVAIRLNAKKGQKAATLFAVSNPGSKSMEATFAVSDFVNEDNHVVKNTEVSFTPDHLNLAPDQEVAVEVAINVSDKFRVGKCYQATVDIPEFPGKEILLQLTVNRAKTAATTRKKA